jgi:hypothetical protein
VLVGWAFGAIVMLGALARSWRSLRKRLEGRRRLEGEPLGDALAALAAREPILMRAPLLSASDKVPVPMALGITRPEICVPERVTRELGRDAQESILAHELGHVARRDPLARLVTSAFCRVFFFQPLNWLAMHRLSACAELLADDWAARRTTRPLELAECLTKVARWVTRPMSGLPVPTMAAGTSELRQRVERLLRGEGLSAEPHRPIWAAPIVAFVLTALTFLAPTACGVAEAKGLPSAATPAAQKGARAQAKTAKFEELADDDEDEDEDENDDAVCESPRGKQDDRDHARRERHHGDEHARGHRRHHHEDADDSDDSDDDDDDADEDEDEALAELEHEHAHGPGRIHVRVPRVGAPDVHVDVDPQIDIDIDSLEKSIKKSIPSKKELDEQIERAMEQARKHAPDAKARKRMEKALEQARKTAHEDLEQALEDLNEHMRDLREQMPEIRRRAMTAAREANQRAREQALEAAEDARREAVEEAHRETDKARKEIAKAHKEADKAREKVDKAREKADKDARKAEKKQAEHDDEDDEDDDD